MTKNLNPINPILIVDDERSALDGFEIALHTTGFNNIITCQDSREVIPILKRTKIDLVLLDLIMPHISGNELIVEIKKICPDLPIIVLTAVSEIDSVVSCMKNGALDYILKPVEKEQLKSRVNKSLEMIELERENDRLRHGLLTGQLQHPEAFSQIITSDPQMISIFRYCEAVAGTSRPILITGDTGTGKELIASAIHSLSRRSGEFVAVNIAAFDDSIFADTLFGHVRGAFTGADKARKGLVESACGGTLFLDEIGDLSLVSQVKLLRLLQEQEFSPVGSDRVKRSNIRVVVSTHRDISALKSENRFREDLYYRLISHHIHLPPLKERPGDIKLLLDYFLDVESRDMGKKRPTYHPEIVTLLKTYSFPGNIREFRAIVVDAIAKHNSHMLSSKSFQEYINMEALQNHKPITQDQTFSSLEALTFDPDNLPGLREVIFRVSEKLINEAMKKTGDNQTVAARLLGISQQSLSAKIKQIKSHVDRT